MELMTGFPPLEEARVTLANWRTAPYNRWAFHHVREIVPTAEIANDPNEVWDLPCEEKALPELESMLDGWSNDALVILHRGALVHESYRCGMAATDPHILMSVSKSLLGLVAGTLVDTGELDVSAPITTYLPELAGTAYAGATVRQALDMEVGLHFAEDYFATSGPIIDYRKAMNWQPLEPGEEPMDLRSFQSVLTEQDSPHGQRFRYASPVTDMLGWLLERASGRRFADLLSERLLRPLGAERAGYITVDRIGGARAAGGICLTARDLARIGQMMLQGGAGEGRQVIPQGWLRDIFAGGNKAAWQQGDFADRFPGVDMSYRSKWYINHDSGVIHARGIHGQLLLVDPTHELVIVWLSSEALPVNPDWTAHVFAAAERIRAACG